MPSETYTAEMTTEQRADWIAAVVVPGMAGKVRDHVRRRARVALSPPLKMLGLDGHVITIPHLGIVNDMDRRVK